ncbi:YeeE/YedE family protein [bacterium]|nr:YeeE/YedE family protein [bacterium]MCI0603821.1 YeeE/YedE family protein [bacterium]
MEWLRQPWPWYIAGPLIGLAVPALLIAGNKALGISSSLRHICAACFPANIPFLKYDWKKESWNLFFAAGIVIGGFLSGYLLRSPDPVAISAKTVQDLQALGIEPQTGLLPHEIFNWHSLVTFPGLIFIVAGGFLVGFGTRYAGGCTSGHGIMGLSSFQLPSLIALLSFFAGGIAATYLLLPRILLLIR